MYSNENKGYQIDSAYFKKQLIQETNLLKSWFENNYFTANKQRAGAEIEFLLLDNDYQLAPQNMQFVKECNDPRIVPEAGTFQLEINTDVVALDRDLLKNLHSNMLNLWNKSLHVAGKRKQQLALIGSMPNSDLLFTKQEYITPEHDFYVMNESTIKYRKILPLIIKWWHLKEIQEIYPYSLALEGQICSFQLHLEVQANHTLKFFNIIQLITPLMVALCNNSPFLLGKRMWCESRISIFEQLYNFGDSKTVFIEPNIIENSLFSIFEENVQYPYLVPSANSEPLEHMIHVRRQNSCLFRWNRPILDFYNEHFPYLRLEHRAIPSGPTILDMVANAAFFYGIVFYFAQQNQSIDVEHNFKHNVLNFYNAAQQGLGASVKWNRKVIKAYDLLHHLLPLAFQGLEYIGVELTDIKNYLEIIEMRVLKKQTGSLWQQRFLEKNGSHFQYMLQEYISNQNLEIPIADWRI